MNRFMRRLISLGLLLFLLLFGSTWLWQRSHDTATFSFSSPPYTAVIGQEIPVAIHIDTGRRSINAVAAHLLYDPNELEIISMTTTDSFCKLYTENHFYNSRGELNLECGTPNPGFTGKSTLVQFIARPLRGGTLPLRLDPSSSIILANDGKGSNIVGEIPSYALHAQEL